MLIEQYICLQLMRKKQKTKSKVMYKNLYAALIRKTLEMPVF